jgi:hypothetical protein
MQKGQKMSNHQICVLTTSKWDAVTSEYKPVLREEIDPEARKSIIDFFAGKPPLHGFFRHQVADSRGTVTCYSACADILGFIKANHKNPTPNGKEDRAKTTGPEEVQ